ncbi:MAG TPA: GNAT family N-acetyltransferase [Terriglobia bacterium]|nr:GNAT family N-acetyltransferase [Terriglobia bacterium]
MHLRAFRADDLETLYNIDQACFAPGISYPRQELSGFISQRRSRTWVAEESGEIVGFLIAERQAQKVAHIVTIDVVERWRRQRVGSLLMDAAEQWAAEQKLLLVYLEAAENNAPAQDFYKARGYRKVDHVANYYSDGTSAWVMLKWLKL